MQLYLGATREEREGGFVRSRQSALKVSTRLAQSSAVACWPVSTGLLELKIRLIVTGVTFVANIHKKVTCLQGSSADVTHLLDIALGLKSLLSGLDQV